MVDLNKDGKEIGLEDQIFCDDNLRKVMMMMTMATTKKLTWLRTPKNLKTMMIIMTMMTMAMTIKTWFRDAKEHQRPYLMMTNTMTRITIKKTMIKRRMRTWLRMPKNSASKTGLKRVRISLCALILSPLLNCNMMMMTMMMTMITIWWWWLCWWWCISKLKISH